MSPAPEPVRNVAMSPDQVYRDQGQALLLRLSAVIRVGKAYRVGNQVFNQQLATLSEILDSILKTSEEVALVALDTDLYLNGFRIPIRTQNLKFHQQVLDELRKRGIAGIRFERGYTRQEVDRFFDLFMHPDGQTGAALLEACIAGGALHVQPVVHATTFAPDAPLGPPGEHKSDPLARGDGGTGSGTGRGPGGEGVGPGEGGGAAAGHFDEDRRPGATAVRKRMGGGGGTPKGAPRKSYWAAMANAKSLLAPTADAQQLQMKHAKRVVQPLVDDALQDQPVVVGLGTLYHKDDFTYAHVVNVVQVAVSMGRVLGLDRKALADLGVAALLHDVGKNAVADQIKNPIDGFSDEERAAAERHPVEGVKILARSTSLNPTTVRCMRVALEHHLGEEGRGYPKLPGWKPSVLSRIVSVADCYCTLQTYRSRHGGNVTPAQALGMVLGPYRTWFDPLMLWALVQTVGFYPPGQLVELDDGHLALVIAPNGTDLERPHCLVVARTDRRRMTEAEKAEYRPLPAGLKVVRALKAEEYPSPDEGGPAATPGEGGTEQAA